MYIYICIYIYMIYIYIYMVTEPNPKPSEASARSDDCQAWAGSSERSALTSDDLEWGLGLRVF